MLKHTCNIGWIQQTSPTNETSFCECILSFIAVFVVGL